MEFHLNRRQFAELKQDQGGSHADLTLLSIGVLLGGVLLRHPVSRIAIIALAIPVAIVVNGVRVFVTGFLVAFVDPSLADGFTHITEGWLLFLVAFAILAVITLGVVRIERRVLETSDSHA